MTESFYLHKEIEFYNSQEVWIGFYKQILHSKQILNKFIQKNVNSRWLTSWFVMFLNKFIFKYIYLLSFYPTPTLGIRAIRWRVDQEKNAIQ